MNKKLDIIVYSVDYPTENLTQECFDKIRYADKNFQYPFGYGKLQMHGPFSTATGFRVYASVRMYMDKYIRKCAYSYSKDLRNICYGFIQQFYPNEKEYFTNICIQADSIRQSIMKRNIDKKVKEELKGMK